MLQVTSGERTRLQFSTRLSLHVVTRGCCNRVPVRDRWARGIPHHPETLQSHLTPSVCLRALQAEVLEALRPMHALVDVVLQHRSVHKLLTGFIHTLACFLDRVPRPPPADGKVGIKTTVLHSL